jgi:hypothetical protein
MTPYTCPSCGADLSFRSRVSVYAVCASCGSTVMRTDLDVTQIGVMAALPDEISPFQVGTGLGFYGKRFTLVGRVRIGWDDGAWTEWFMDDGAKTQAWLTEAQGLLAVSSEQSLPPGFADALPVLGATIEHGGAVLRVSDIKRGICLGSEGELPFAAPQGRAANYLDMVGPNAEFAGIEDGPDGRRFYTGQYVPFDKLGFTNLREVDGWPPLSSPPDHRLDPRYVTVG